MREDSTTEKNTRTKSPYNEQDGSPYDELGLSEDPCRMMGFTFVIQQ